MRLCFSEPLVKLWGGSVLDGAFSWFAPCEPCASHDFERRLGAGVILGSNVFNLAALLGLGAVVAGGIGLHRKVVVLGGTVTTGVAGVCVAVVLGLLPPAAGCLLGLVVVALYVVALGVPRPRP